MSLRSGVGRASAALIAVAATTGLALAGPFPYRVAHRVDLGGTAPVLALVAGPGAKLAYAAVGKEVRSFDASGKPHSSVRLAGVVTGLAAGTGATLYAAVRAPARLVVLGLHPLRVLRSAPLRAGAPSALMFDPLSHELFAASQAARALTRLDPATGRALGVLRLRGEPMQMVADGRGTVYLANSAQNAIDVVDASTMTLAGQIPLARCRAPSALAMDTLGRRLFVGCGNGRELIVDADLGFTFVRLPLQQAASLQAAFAFHPLGPAGWKGGAFVAGGSRLTAIRMYAFVRYAGGGTLPLSRPTTALALDPAAGELWLAEAPRADATGPGGAAGPTLLVLGPTCAETSR